MDERSIERQDVYSWSLNREYSSSPTLTGEPPYYIAHQSMFKLTFQVLKSIAYHAATFLNAFSHQQSQCQHTCGIRTLSPTDTEQLTLFPSLSRPPGPTANTFASLSSLTLDSGKKIPEAVLVSAFMRCTRTRSRSGARDLMDFNAVD